MASGNSSRTRNGSGAPARVLVVAATTWSFRTSVMDRLPFAFSSSVRPPSSQNRVSVSWTVKSFRGEATIWVSPTVKGLIWPAKAGLRTTGWPGSGALSVRVRAGGIFRAASTEVNSLETVFFQRRLTL